MKNFNFKIWLEANKEFSDETWQLVLQLARDKLTNSEIAERVNLTRQQVRDMLKHALLKGLINRDEMISKDEERIKRNKKIKSTLNSPEVLEKLKSIQKKNWEDQERRDQHSKFMLNKWKDQEYLNKQVAKRGNRWSEEDSRERHSRFVKNWWKQQGGYWRWLANKPIEERRRAVTSLARRFFPNDEDKMKEMLSRLLNIVEKSPEDILKYADQKDRENL